jgi:hypothetical protein
MTSLHERTGFEIDPLDRAAEETEPAPLLSENESDVRASSRQAIVLDAPAVTEQPVSPDTATVTGAPDAESRGRFAAWVTTVFGRDRDTFARSPKRPRREKKQYPPRFSIEFETSLVDRERRRL